ncbi:MAG: dihydrofolate reductase family protein, partial [Fimbriimonadales bacterium]|nr:dihydrofolate reductase family protein [Fimbriimonadales bacterium]
LSLDGKIATHTGDSKWITSERARRAAHRLRAEHAAVLVGIRTVLKDQPHLTARIKGVVNQPLRVVLDSKLRIADLARETSDTRLLPPLLQEGNNTLVFALSADEEPVRAKIKYLESLGVQVICLAPDPKQPSRVPVRKVVELLAERGVCSVLVEGGGQVAASFLEARLANRIAYFYAPKLIGGADAPTALEGSGIMRVADAPRITNLHIRKLGDDWLVEGDIEYR